MVLKTHLNPFREPLKVPPACATAKEPFFSKSVRFYDASFMYHCNLQNIAAVAKVRIPLRIFINV